MPNNFACTSNMTAKPDTIDEVNKGIRASLRHPVIYNLFGWLVGMPDKYRMYVNTFMEPKPNMRILDIGCGTASILDVLPSNIYYAGYDINYAYINYAQKKYRQKAFFFNQRVSEITIVDSDPFDVVLADGLLHHLNDTEAKQLIKIGYNALSKDGIMLTIDPTFVEKQNIISRLFTMADRGQHVRCPQKYAEIASSCFLNPEVHVVHNVGNIPLTGCLIKGRK